MIGTVDFRLLTKNGDGGDSCNRTCATVLSFIYKGYQLKRNDPELATLNNPNKPWLWRRSPHVGKWYSNWDRMSRDQTIPLLILMGEAKLHRELIWYILGHMFRGFLFTHNTRRNFVYLNIKEHLEKSTPDVPWRPQWKLPDITGPEFWALEIRALPLILRTCLFPVLILLDVETLVGSIIRRLFRRSNCDVINHTLILINGLRRSCTPTIWLASKITNRHFLQPRLDGFFSDAGEPPLNEFLLLPVDRYL